MNACFSSPFVFSVLSELRSRWTLPDGRSGAKAGAATQTQSLYFQGQISFISSTCTRTQLVLIWNTSFWLRTFIERLFRGEKFEADDEVASSNLLSCSVALEQHLLMFRSKHWKTFLRLVHKYRLSQWRIAAWEDISCFSDVFSISLYTVVPLLLRTGNTSSG